MAFESETFVSKAGELEFSARFAPIYIASFRGEQDPEQLQAFLDLSTNVFFDQEKRFAYVIDATRVTTFTGANRKQQTDWLQQNSELVGRDTVVVSFALASAMHRGVITAIHWVRPPVYPYKISPNRKKAIDEAVKALAEAGLDPPHNLADSYESPFG